MKRMPILVLLVLLAAAAPAVCENFNIAPNCRIIVSDVVNPAWDGQKIADRDLGPTKGWLGKYDAANPPWAKLILPYPAKIDSIRVIPAMYKELGKKRYSRPKKVSVLLKGDKPEVRDFELKDDETQYQELKIGLDNVYELSIIIKEVYPGKNVPDQTGFQEVQVMAEPAGEVISQGGRPVEETPSPVEETKRLLEKVNEKVGAQAAAPSGGAGNGGLTPDEQEILDLLRQLMEKLEKKFRED